MLRFFAPDHRSPAAPLAAAAPRAGGDRHDAALIERVVGGDMAAFESLYRDYHPRLTRFLSLLTQRRTIVEEAVNDTMLAVWRRAHTYNGASKVSTWIFAIAYRTACKALRQQDLPVEDPSDEAASDAPGPERQSAAREAQAALRRALRSLSHEQRHVVVLTYFHELPYAEIAHIMGCPVDTVKTRMFHGRRRLRALLAGEAGDWL
jgi:RNA polymerase sigma factor (sigma-70 family)